MAGPTLEVDLNFMVGAIMFGGPPYNSLELAILYSITADSAYVRVLFYSYNSFTALM